ncbi:hypothetical protein [Streptomyces sp. NPDC002133]|uniref:hypothetical protein n=1 Tax=Streptomyces sp. NPDC002133 TaxID=3154409 RepID=UPI0033203B02
MTRSGQGDEAQLPAAQPAHEGVVLPADGSEPWIPGVSGEQVAPAGGAPWGQPWGPEQGQPQPYQQPQPQQMPGQPEAYAQQMPGQPEVYAQQMPGQPEVYAQQMPGQPEVYAQPLPPHQQLPQPHQAAQPLPPYDAGGTAQLPGQYAQTGGQLPAAAPDADATQYIAPFQPAAGAPLPYEKPAESTQLLGMQPAAAGGDAEATQYLPPVPQGAPYGVRPGAPGDRQPPAEFDNLFRSEDAAAGGGAEATQYLPPVPPQPHPQQSYAQQSYEPTPQYQPPYEPPYADEPQQRSRSRVPLIAAVVVGCAVLGLGASALMFGGGDDDKGQNDDKTVAAATSPGSTAGAADPAKGQAEALDKLLADSGDSRDAVIAAVDSIRRCDNLDRAAEDLRGAAEQRRGLVTRLEGLSVDKLPDNAALTKALTEAWEASAKADDHYAAWAGQVDGKKGCRDGKARQTSQSAQATRASGDATKAKQEASGLWNSIATTYGLTKREPRQL